MYICVSLNSIRWTSYSEMPGSLFEACEKNKPDRMKVLISENVRWCRDFFHFQTQLFSVTYFKWMNKDDRRYIIAARTKIRPVLVFYWKMMKLKVEYSTCKTMKAALRFIWRAWTEMKAWWNFYAHKVPMWNLLIMNLIHWFIGLQVNSFVCWSDLTKSFD